MGQVRGHQWSKLFLVVLPLVLTACGGGNKAVSDGCKDNLISFTTAKREKTRDLAKNYTKAFKDKLKEDSDVKYTFKESKLECKTPEPPKEETEEAKTKRLKKEAKEKKMGRPQKLKCEMTVKYCPIKVPEKPKPAEGEPQPAAAEAAAQ
jgi:hypothetical protein